MKRRQWSGKERFQVVLDGLSGKTEISKLCAKYQIAQTQYYRWRDQLLQFGNQAFETKNITKREQRLVNENKRLNIVELIVELRKQKMSCSKTPEIGIGSRKER